MDDPDERKAENRTYEEDLAKLKKPGDIIAALKSSEIDWIARKRTGGLLSDGPATVPPGFQED